MKKIIAIALFIFIEAFIEPPIVVKLNGNAELFAVDKLGNSYVYASNQLAKYNVNGELLAQFSQLNLGKLTSIDVSDPFQLLLFYKDFNQVLFLDNKLAPLGTAFQFDDVDLLEVTAVCKSKQWAVWLFDEYENKLVQYGFHPKGVLQTINIDKYNKGLNNINFMQEKGTDLYMNQQNKCVWIFNQYGSKLEQLPIKIKNDFQVVSNKLVFSYANSVCSYSLHDGVLDTIRFQNYSTFRQAKIAGSSVYIVKSDSLIILPERKE